MPTTTANVDPLSGMISAAIPNRRRLNAKTFNVRLSERMRNIHAQSKFLQAILPPGTPVARQRELLAAFASIASYMMVGGSAIPAAADGSAPIGTSGLMEEERHREAMSKFDELIDAIRGVGGKPKKEKEKDDSSKFLLLAAGIGTAIAAMIGKLFGIDINAGGTGLFSKLGKMGKAFGLVGLLADLHSRMGNYDADAAARTKSKKNMWPAWIYDALGLQKPGIEVDNEERNKLQASIFTKQAEIELLERRIEEARAKGQGKVVEFWSTKKGRAHEELASMEEKLDTMPRSGSPTSISPSAQAEGGVTGGQGTTISAKRADLAAGVYDAWRNAGYSHEGALHLTAEVGREGGFLAKNIFGSHTDFNNQKTNLGMWSWQGSRRDQLLEYLKQRDLLDSEGNMKRSQEALNAMAEFAKWEMEEGGERARGGAAVSHLLQQETVAPELAVEGLRSIIRYDPNAPGAITNRKKYFQMAEEIVGARNETQLAEAATTPLITPTVAAVAPPRIPKATMTAQQAASFVSGATLPDREGLVDLHVGTKEHLPRIEIIPPPTSAAAPAAEGREHQTWYHFGQPDKPRIEIIQPPRIEIIPPPSQSFGSQDRWGPADAMKKQRQQQMLEESGRAPDLISLGPARGVDLHRVSESVATGSIAQPIVMAPVNVAAVAPGGGTKGGRSGKRHSMGPIRSIGSARNTEPTFVMAEKENRLLAVKQV